jgi:hypothetical protein
MIQQQAREDKVSSLGLNRWRNIYINYKKLKLWGKE